MEKPNINFSVSHIIASAKAMVGRTMNADTLWRVIMGSVFCVTLAVCVFAYLTYMWAINTELPQGVTKRDHNVFSLTDLKKAITLYQTKEETYNKLLSTRPVAPPYAKGKGVVIAPPDSSAKDTVSEASGTPSIVPVVKDSVLP